MGQAVRVTNLERPSAALRRLASKEKDAAAQEAFRKRMARPVCKCFLFDDPASLLQCIRPGIILNFVR